VDSIQHRTVFEILYKYLPTNVITKLDKFVSTKPNQLRNTVDFITVQSQIDPCNLKYCVQELIIMLQETQHTECKIFHLGANEKKKISMEPTKKRTEHMI
jgi:hypothetical protein